VLSDRSSGYEALCEEEAWPLSRLYHQHSKLSDRKQEEFEEVIAAYSQDEEAIRRSSRASKPYPTKRKIGLPRAGRTFRGGPFRGGRLVDLLRSRRTRRGQFSPRPMTVKQWGRLFEMACGLTGQVAHPNFPDIVQDLRAWPSGGAMYPIEVYLAALGGNELEPAWYHYQVASHELARLDAAALDSRPEGQPLQRLVFADGLWENAGGLLVLTGLFARTQEKYGERGYRFVLLDAGHLAQNILLACEDLGLAAIPLGGFDDDGLARSLGLDARKEAPVYTILVGNRK